MREWEWEGMEINILLWEGMFLHNNMRIGWEWEYGRGNGGE